MTKAEEIQLALANLLVYVNRVLLGTATLDNLREARDWYDIVRGKSEADAARRAAMGTEPG